MLNSLEKQALRAAHPFGGYALASHRPVMDSLESKGLIEIICTDTEGTGYVLTPAGKARAKTPGA